MKKLILSVSAIAIMFSACKKDDHDDIHPHSDSHSHEQEVITSIVATFTDISDNKVYTFKFSDPDGAGGNNGVILTDTLPANSNFTVSFDILNESKTPTDTITKEVSAEAKEHQLFYLNTPADSTTGIMIMYNDKDADNNPIGLIATATTKGLGTGTLKITLRHGLNKSAVNVSNGDITNAGGETDIEVIFPYVIK